MKVEYDFIELPDEPLYRDDAARTLAVVFDVGVNVAGLSGQYVADAFVDSGIATQFERRNPVYVAGKSGVELLYLMVPDAAEVLLDTEVVRLGRTPEWWAGWSLAWYQFATGRRYKTIFSTVSFDTIVSLYHPLHEADERKFVAVLEGMVSSDTSRTNLGRIREAWGYSQSQLSRMSGVGLRSIQMYEQRQKDINKAQASTLLRLSRVLHCSMEDLMEL